MPAEYGEPLSDRELEIVALVTDGLTNREIAERTFVSPNTVKVHLRHIFAKTGVASRTELSMLAVREGWVAVSQTEEAESASRASDGGAVEPLAPAWPLMRWISLGVGVILALGVLLLPPQPLTGSEENGGSMAAALVDSPNSVVGELPEPAEGAAWGELAPLPVRRARMGMAVVNDVLYAVGGLTADGPTGELNRYDFGEDRWRTLAPRPATLANVGAASLGDALFVPGGCDAQGMPDARVHLYDPDTDVWKDAAPMPEPLCAYALAAYEGKVYLFGGWDGAHYRALTYIYDPEQDAWESGPPPFEARAFGAATALGERIFYVGGYDGDERATCEAYDPVLARWDRCASLLLPRGGLGVAAVGGQLYAVGGGWEGYLGFNERYDPQEDSWTVLASPLVGEWRNLGLVSWETTLYAVGGWSGDYLNRTYSLEVLPFRIFIPVTLP